MFEKLTKGELIELRNRLSDAYLDSQQVSHEIRDWIDAASIGEQRLQLCRDLQDQGGVRAENTSLRWEIQGLIDA